MDKYVIHQGAKATAPFEYFCRNCLQLRLSLADIDICGNCDSSDIVKGKPGELDREKLKSDSIHQETKS